MLTWLRHVASCAAEDPYAKLSVEGRILFWWKTLVDESIGNAPPDDCPEPELGALNRLVVYTTDWWVDGMLPAFVRAVLRTDGITATLLRASRRRLECRQYRYHGSVV